tara:strand:+ start:1407 stop:1883 length:477 start_codon:yes stop_codon:yes gene_type:complete
MSFRRVGASPHQARSRLCDVLAAGVARAPTGAYTKEVPFPDARGRFVFVTATSPHEIKTALENALAAAWANSAKDPSGQDVITVRSMETSLQLSIIITVDSASSRVILSGNVGGRHMSYKPTGPHATDDHIPTIVAGMYVTLGENKGQAVKVEYSVRA